MKTKNIFYAGLCALFMLTSAMCCDDDDSEGIIELTGIKLNQYNNTGAYPVIIENGQCPKEAYLIRILQHKYPKIPYYSFPYHHTDRFQ